MQEIPLSVKYQVTGAQLPDIFPCAEDKVGVEVTVLGLIVNTKRL